MVRNQDIIVHDLRKEIEILFKLMFSLSTIVFNMMKPLVILQGKLCKTVIKESHTLKFTIYTMQ